MTGIERCAGCGKFTRGPMMDYSEDSSDPGIPPEWVGPCCQTPADRGY